MTNDTETTYAVLILDANEGIVLRRSADDEPGAYCGMNAPAWLSGEPNHFVGNSIAEAKGLAMEHLADLIEEIQATFEDLEGL